MSTTPTFDELEQHVAAARRALGAPLRAEAASEKCLAVRNRVYLQVNKHYDGERDDVAARLKDAAQPTLDAIVMQHADAAFVAEIEAGAAALQAARNALPFLMAKACIELGVSAREIGALVETLEPAR